MPSGVIPSRRVPLLTIGTVVWLSSEVMFFGALLGAYFTLKAGADGPFPPEGADLDAALTGLFTLVLLASSATAHLAVTRLEAGDRLAFRRLFLVTAFLGLVFLAGQAAEWAALDFDIDDHSYGSSFYLTTGFHGLHLAAGVVALGLMAARASSPRFGPAHLPSAEVVSYYWHFVDAVWIVLFASFYLVS